LTLEGRSEIVTMSAPTERRQTTISYAVMGILPLKGQGAFAARR